MSVFTLIIRAGRDIKIERMCVTHKPNISFHKTFLAYNELINKHCRVFFFTWCLKKKQDKSISNWPVLDNKFKGGKYEILKGCPR